MLRGELARASAWRMRNSPFQASNYGKTNQRTAALRPRTQSRTRAETGHAVSRTIRRRLIEAADAGDNAGGIYIEQCVTVVRRKLTAGPGAYANEGASTPGLI